MSVRAPGAGAGPGRGAPCVAPPASSHQNDRPLAPTAARSGARPMQLRDLFTADDLVLDFAPGDKWEAIRGLVAHLAERGRLPEALREPVLEAVLSRERSMSTGMEHGVAIPHAAVEGIDRVAAAMGLVRDDVGLPFESIDGQPARLVVLLVIPRAQKLLHIRTLADVARVLGDADVRSALLAADTPRAAWEVLAAHDAQPR